jgi:hypothetical protein
MRTSRRLLRVAAPLLVLSLFALPGCPEEPPRQTSAVGPGSGPAGGTGSGGAAATTTSATGGNGGQGGGACMSCGEFFVSHGFGASLAPACGWDASSQTCAVDSSCDIITNLDLCACGDPPGVPGLCDSACTFSCTGSGSDDPGCQDCITAQCASESTQCNADPGTP